MLESWVEAAASTGVEPPRKKLKPNTPPSFLSLPDEIILHCLARISSSYYPKLSLVSKTFRSLIISTELSYARFHHKTGEPHFSICLQLPDCPRPSWFTLWVQPDQIEKKKKKNKKKKKKVRLVQVPSSSYAPREPGFIRSVGSDCYAFRQTYPPSQVMLVGNSEKFLWDNAPRMTVARVNPSACVLDGKIYVLGGCDKEAAAAKGSWGEVFDTKTRTWEPLPDPGDQLRFSLVIRKTEIIGGKLYVTSNEKEWDSVYDPVTRKWDAIGKLLECYSECKVGNLFYSCGRESCMWYDKECDYWKYVKGLSSLDRTCRRGLIQTVQYCGKLLILWDKLANRRSNCEEKIICCALVALEKRQDGHVWGKVEWSNEALTVSSSYLFLRSCIVRK
ncbi:F-box/kelch-repeat protein At4g39753-like [Raphanus sativus]|uniref:F-box/kelch-repeat protein At4g39753-like n=1 Tax=Raphanus sativus TaxID=3726 RepID=A0A6J0K749_RAPSA|nr:F-box/kelch-repeat protein At4g39753-like [Raphanus sativus]